MSLEYRYDFANLFDYRNPSFSTISYRLKDFRKWYLRRRLLRQMIHTVLESDHKLFDRFQAYQDNETWCTSLELYKSLKKEKKQT